MASIRPLYRIYRPLSGQSQLARFNRFCQCRRLLTTANLNVAPKRAPKTSSFESNPLDPVGNKRRLRAELNLEKKQFNRLAIVTVLCMLATYGIAQFTPLAAQERTAKAQDSSTRNASLHSARSLKADSPKDAPESFQGAPVTVAPGGAKLVAHTNTGEDIELVPTGISTISHIPRTITLEGQEYSLLGVGVRTVSFLGFEVYVVGMYIATSSISTLQAKMVKAIAPGASTLIAGEKDELRKTLTDGDESYKLWNEILTAKADQDVGKISLAIRVAPTRNTDFHHLRDGWIRGITQRSQQPTPTSPTSAPAEFRDQTFGMAVKNFSALFSGKGKAPIGSVMFMTRDGDGKLKLLYQNKDQTEPEKLGEVNDERIARLIWLGYLGGKNVSSEPAKKSVIDGVVELVERPVGTAATRVI